MKKKQTMQLLSKTPPNALSCWETLTKLFNDTRKNSEFPDEVNWC